MTANTNDTDDLKLIDLFFARSEQAISRLDEKYGSLCRGLSFRILNNRQDAEECVNDAYLGVWNAIPPTRPDPLQTFVCRIVRNLSLKRFYANTAAKRNGTYDAVLDELSELIPSRDTVESELDSRELTRYLEGFLDTLNRENRVIFMSRYWFALPYEEIAGKTGLSVKTVSVRLTRMRKKLKEYLEEREVFL